MHISFSFFSGRDEVEASRKSVILFSVVFVLQVIFCKEILKLPYISILISMGRDET